MVALLCFVFDSSVADFFIFIFYIRMGNRTPDNLYNGSLAMGNYQSHELDICRGFLSISVITCMLLGNTVIVFSYFQNYKMRTVTNTLVINHCLTDMLLALSDIAFFITPAYSPGLMESDVFCTSSVFFDSWFKVASFLSMVCIALDRYINLARASCKRMTKWQVAGLLAWVWLQATLVATPWNQVKPSSGAKSQRALLRRTFPLLFEAGSAINGLSIFFKIICVLLPVLSIYYVSYRVFSAGRGRRRVDVQQGSSIRRRFSSEHFAARSAPAKITAMLLLGVYIVCTAPFLFAVFWTMFPKNQVLAPKVAFAVYFLFRLKGSLFPILYITRNRVVLSSVQKLSCCVKSSVPGAFVLGLNAPRKNDWKRHFTGPPQEHPGLNRSKETAKKPRVAFAAKIASVKLDFTDLKRARRSSRHISGTWI